ncbi:MAG: toll/interleukin-1 receptor domain-containing protein [Rubrivivax sp.]|nr:toll/interleukin-1 receptor domain-containing protein [Rubrivivax sp.]
MTDVFISYKREDEGRVAPLVQGLQAEGLSVWWDRALPGGESWRAQITQALHTARCVVVVWSHGSTGPEGGFVRDEAGRAAQAARLVPVLVDHGLRLPLGFGELQAIDLTRWRGRRSDPFFQDLVAALRAKLAGQPPPAPKGPAWRLRRRLTWGSAGSLLLGLLGAFATNTLQFQNRLCAAPIGQPALADACAALALGGAPTRAERIAWSERRPGSCDDIARHLARFPTGAKRDEANALLAAARTQVTESWGPAPKPQPLSMAEGSQGRLFPTRAAAQAAALERGARQARTLCAGFDASGLTRLRTATVAPVAEEDWQCQRLSGGFECGFTGQALCQQDVLERVVLKTCGEPGQ